MFISDFNLKSSKDFPVDQIFVFLQTLALAEPIMCIDWILLACLPLQMEAGVLFYPGFSFRTLRKETVDFYNAHIGKSKNLVYMKVAY